MTKMATMPIYGKNPLKIFFSGTLRLISTKLGMLHRGLQPIIICSNDDLDLFYCKVKFGYLCFSMGKVKTVDFSETIAACDLKVGRCRQLIEIMKVCEY